MNTKIVAIDPQKFSENELLEAADLIANGKLVAFPTETVYGLGANALDPIASKSIFEAKGRPGDNPLIVHVYSVEDCSLYAETENCPLFWKIAEHFMPGPITVILPKKEIIPFEVTANLDTVALRCPAHPVARELIRLSGVPIAAPSANLSGKPSPTTALHVRDDMTGRIPMIIDGGSCDVGLESTVIAIKNDEIHLLRPGFVTKSDLLEITDRVVISPAVLSSLKEGEKAESPGMKYRHYAPSAPVTMIKGREEDVIAFFRQKEKEGCGILCFDEDLAFFAKSSRVLSFGSKEDLLSQANGLFDALRAFDSVSVPHIYARYTSREDLGLAISNRLLRACSFQILEV